MGVGVEGHGDAGVPKALLDDLRVHAVSQQFARMEVPQIVKAETFHAGFSRDPAPVIVDLVLADRVANGIGEHEVVIGVGVTNTLSVLGLSVAILV